MALRIAHKFDWVRKLLLSGVGMAALGASFLIGIADLPKLCAQSPVSFEVASVKPQPWKEQGSSGVFIHGNTLRAEHCALYDLIEYAWDLRDIQLSGGPAWASRPGKLANADLYQVIAKAEGDSPPPVEQFRLMLQALLADRFQLKIHHVNKVQPVYNLVPTKNGAKLKISPVDAKFSMFIDGRVEGGKLTRMTATHASIAQVIGHIEHSAGRPVFDKTGLTGLYDFEVEWAPDGFVAASPDILVPDSSGPSLFTALQKQLGLKLEPGTAPFDTVVIDHAEKPSEN